MWSKKNDKAGDRGVYKIRKKEKGNQNDMAARPIGLPYIIPSVY